MKGPDEGHCRGDKVGVIHQRRQWFVDVDDVGLVPAQELYDPQQRSRRECEGCDGTIRPYRQ